MHAMLVYGPGNPLLAEIRKDFWTDGGAFDAWKQRGCREIESSQTRADETHMSLIGS